MDNDLLNERIEKNLHKLTNTQKKIADYLSKKPQKVVFQTAKQLSELIKVSEASIIRFAKALEYENYTELQTECQSYLLDHEDDYSFVDRLKIFENGNRDNILKDVSSNDINNIMKLLNEPFVKNFEKAVAKIDNARTVYITGSRASGPLSEYLAYYLNFLRPNVVSLSYSYEDHFDKILDCTSEDVIIGISMSRYTIRTIDILNSTKDMGATVIGVTDSRASPIAEIADISLICETESPSFFWSAATVMTLINAILQTLAQEADEKRVRRLNKLESVIDKNQVYKEKK